jgi:hypothetical protein
VPAWFTRARHADLPPVVMPVEGVEHYPGWVAYGEKSTDVDALNAELFREQRAEDDPAFAPPAGPAPVPVTPVTPAVAPVPAAVPVMAAPAVPVSPAPAGAAPKEQ